jgi:methionyl-tRNA formyltransferase
MNIVFFGSADFGVPALKRLMQTHTVRAIVTTPPRPQGRGLKLGESPIAVFARQQGFAPVLTPDRIDDTDFHRTLMAFGADVFVVVAFRILPKALFSIPQSGTINIHASLLPKYRGPAPIQRAIEAGEKESGVTIFRIDEGVDTGNILLQKRVSIGDNETTPELYARLSELGAIALSEALEGIATGSLCPLPQDAAQASRAPKLTKEEARIDWRQPAVHIADKIRAFKPFPGTYTVLEGKRLGIEQAGFETAESPHEAGTVVAVEGSFFDVRCLPGVLRIFAVKPEGRRAMNVHDFLLGTTLAEGTRLS